MHSIDGFRRPRPESVMAEAELRSIAAPVLFCIGTEDPYLSPTQARPAIANLPTAELYELPGGHGPWLEHPVACANLVRQHLRDTTGAANGNHPLSVR
jgi:pimeloyl-ACP methyl ester carboxylesterase